ncbi:MAG TPA: hypothetical protein DDX98_02515 [Bacteroidales bacterium]|jgi:hypothetical protein|nr:hypothetical protein [Bacteroidales bacterium]
MKRLLFYLTFVSLILATSCEIIKDPGVFEPDQPDTQGNLLIINNSNEQLVLYKDQVVIKKIPASATDFLVNIPNESEATIQLDLFKWIDVHDDVSNPDPTLAFKRWLVPLSNSTDIEDRATWHVEGLDPDVNVATLSLSYYGGTQDNVDVYLNSFEGAKISTMKPGDQYKKVGIDYGNYTLNYLYWTSDQNDATAFEEVGRITTQDINGTPKPIWLVLNEGRKDITMVIPHLNDAQNTGTKYAGLTVQNDLAEPVRIQVNGTEIENVCYLETGSTQNLSTIAEYSSYTYYIPINEEEATQINVTMTATVLAGVDVIDGPETITLTADETTTWVVDGE